MAVADKYVLKMHEPENKFATPADTLAEVHRAIRGGGSRFHEKDC